MKTAKNCSPFFSNSNPFIMFKNNENGQVGQRLHNFSRAIDGFFSGNNLKDFFQTDAAHVVPAANIWEENTHLYIALAAAGLQKEDFKISLEGDLLTISTQKPSEKPNEKAKFYRKEFNFQFFKRSFRLDLKEFDPQQISARYENGVLTLTIPQRAEKAPDSLKINVQ